MTKRTFAIINTDETLRTGIIIPGKKTPVDYNKELLEELKKRE